MAIFNIDGTPDVTLSAPLPTMHEAPAPTHIGTNTMIHRVDGRWHQTNVQSNTLIYGEELFPRRVILTRQSGLISNLLDCLGAATMLRLDVVKDAQLVVNMPIPLERGA